MNALRKIQANEICDEWWECTCFSFSIVIWFCNVIIWCFNVSISELSVSSCFCVVSFQKWKCELKYINMSKVITNDIWFCYFDFDWSVLKWFKSWEVLYFHEFYFEHEREVLQQSERNSLLVHYWTATSHILWFCILQKTLQSDCLFVLSNSSFAEVDKKKSNNWMILSIVLNLDFWFGLEFFFEEELTNLKWESEFSKFFTNLIVTFF